MAISRKPKVEASRHVPVTDVEALINKGGSVSQQEQETKDKNAMAVVVRVPVKLLEKVDYLLAQRPIKTPRHTWILEAMLEKLEKESDS